MAIYDLGTASLVENGEVTGVGTTWKAPLTLIRAGATIVFKTEPVQIYTISEIISDTQINVYNPNSETVPAGTGYAILAHDGITVQGLAQDVAETLRYYQSRETEIADAVDAFNNFDSADFESKVAQVDAQHGDVVSIGAQVANDAAQVTTDKNAAAASATSALSAKDAAATSAQEAADYAASLDTQNLLRKDLALSDLTDKPLARQNLDVYSKGEISSRGFVSVKDFGAKGDGVTDDSDAIISALNSSLNVYFPAGTYIQSKQVTIRSGHYIVLGTSTIQLTSELVTAAWRASYANNFSIIGGRFVGTGLDNTSGNGHMILLENCEYGLVDGCIITKGSQDGLRMVSCRNMIIDKARSFNNLVCGIQDRDGFNNSILSGKFNYNGNTGVAPANNLGRGILLWRCVGSIVSNVTTNNNTEYGLRVYSQNDDVSSSSSILISGVQSSNNQKIDVYVYNEEGGLNSINLSNTSIYRNSQPNSAMVSIQGSNIVCSNFVLKQIGNRLATPCVSFYNATNCSFSSSSATNVGQLFSFSGGGGVEISDIVAECSKVGFGGVNVRYKGCRFTHGGESTTDVAIDANTSKNSIINCYFDGFYRNITWNSQGMVIIGNESANTTDTSVRMYGDGLPYLTFYGNRFDTATNPSILGSLTRTDNKSRATAYGGAAPTTLTWVAGDIVYNINPSGTSFIEKWICTSSGTPGTWIAK
ncbi:lateral tail fiber protein [Escherichia phage JulesPiccard]|uniref:Lateral tail fiber protein n=1 Tax=Escherichia phage JulesPiccard TaxID=2851956 RepID=A0AAE8B2G9_9CAUD|nr:lateral tail fiber protein [Escherichia phage JulesPiccard]